jgi:hypothetical protein
MSVTSDARQIRWGRHGKVQMAETAKILLINGDESPARSAAYGQPEKYFLMTHGMAGAHPEG